MSCAPWSVVRVPFPYADRPVVQHRPALVVAVPEAADGLPVLWVVMVTSAAHRRWPGDVVITELVGTGLPAPSVVRCARLATIDAEVAEPLGQLAAPDRHAVSARSREMLADVLAG